MYTLMLDSPLLVNFMQTFVGYGNASAPYWYIGMEKGGDLASIPRPLSNIIGIPRGDG